METINPIKFLRMADTEVGLSGVQTWENCGSGRALNSLARVM
jgi:hypothetical protein